MERKFEATTECGKKGTCALPEGRLVDGKIALIQAHRNNILRYQRLLKTRLTDMERRYIKGRLSEEQAALQHHVRSFGTTAFDYD